MAIQKTLDQKIYEWFDRRFDLTTAQKLAAKKQVPVHGQSLWYYLGGIAIVILGIQVLTGLLLMIYYVPEIKSAHASILALNSQIDFGWFVRSMHSWGANLFILALFVHMFSAYFMKAYRPPREITWLTGLGLMVLAFGFGFTGYLLPWDEVSFFASKIGLDITSKAPIIGESMAYILRGGTDVSQDTLSRFFMIHVILLPIGLALLLGLHLMLVQTHGMSEPEEFRNRPEEKKEYEPFFPNFALKDAMVWILTINVLAVLVSLFPWGVGPEADPFAPAPIGIKPEWYFLAMFQFLKLIPPHVGPIEGEQFGMVLIGAVAGLFAVMPFLDTGKSRAMSRFATFYGVAVVILFVLFTIWVFVA